MRRCHDEACRCSGTGKITNPHATDYKAECRVCPVCRTQELVEELLIKANDDNPADGWIVAHFGGDPRGAVLKLETPNHGANTMLAVPARRNR